jgi:hypothetical protein
MPNYLESLFGSTAARPLSRDFIEQDSLRRSGMGDPEKDRELEGEMYGSLLPGGMGLGLAAGLGTAYEGILKPAAENSSFINSILPEAFRYQEGVSSPSWVNGGAGQAASRLGALMQGAVRGSFTPRKLF